MWTEMFDPKEDWELPLPKASTKLECTTPDKMEALNKDAAALKKIIEAHHHFFSKTNSADEYAKCYALFVTKLLRDQGYLKK
jgi:hypothetical protein